MHLTLDTFCFYPNSFIVLSPATMADYRESHSSSHENITGNGGTIKNCNVTLFSLSSSKSTSNGTITTTDPLHPVTINRSSNNSEPTSGINQLDLNQKLKEKRTGGCDDNDYVNPSFIHHSSSSSSKGANVSDYVTKETLKTHQVENAACPMKESLIWPKQNLKRYDHDFLFKKIDGSSVSENIFEKVVLRPQGGVGRGIRTVYHNNNNNNEPIKNNINQQHHHHNDSDNNNNQKKVIDDVVVNEGEDGRIKSLPYKKNGPYTCSKCMAIFETSQKFAAHTASHYKHESKAQRMKRQMAKMMRRNKKRARELKQQQMKDFEKREGGESALQVEVEVEDQAQNNNNNINNYDAPPGFDIRFGDDKIKMEPFP
nr:homeobox protein 13-like [Arachis hypogaea]